MADKLRQAAQALIDRWDSPAWGGSAENLRHTGEYIAELRAALDQSALVQQPAVPPDNGPWQVDEWTNNQIVLQSHDFTHDVALVINGDFESKDQKHQYAVALAAILNAAPPAEVVPASGSDKLWHMYMCSSDTGREFLINSGDEHPMRDHLARLSNAGSDVWLITPDGIKVRPETDAEAVPAVPPGHKLVPVEPTTIPMTAKRAEYFIERSKHEEKMLGPNEQAALDFVIAMLNAAPEAPAQGQCGLCGADQPFTGSCGGGRENPLALCFAAPAAQNDRDAQEAPFEQWWEKHGQFCRAGGGDYEKTFAWNAWCAAAQKEQP